MISTTYCQNLEVQLAARAYPQEVFTIKLPKLLTRDVLLAKLISRVQQPHCNETTTVKANGSLGPTLFLRLPAVQPDTLTRIRRQLSNFPSESPRIHTGKSHLLPTKNHDCIYSTNQTLVNLPLAVFSLRKSTTRY